MSLKPIICSRCQGDTGQRVDTDDEKPVYGEHIFQEDCIKELVERLVRVESEYVRKDELGEQMHNIEYENERGDY